MSGPLCDLRVLDLSRILAGPWASQTLADLGAEVIKIERPGSGDDTRGWGPPFIETADGQAGDAAYFLSTNRGKYSLALDIASAEGQELVRALALKSDVLIENFKVGGLKKYQLDYDSLKAVNPGLIYCSITGFGQTGPYAQRAGYDFMIQGMGGIMSVTGQPDGTPGAEPLKCGVAFADVFTGLYSVAGILSALHHRSRTGEGQHLDMALLDCQVAVLANQATNYLVSGTPPGRLGNAHPNIVPYQVFETADGHIIIAVGNDRQFRSFCSLFGREDLADNAKFATNPARVENRGELTEILSKIIRIRTTLNWMKALEDVSVPCGPINSIEDVFGDPQVQSRGMAITGQRPDGTPTPGVANPIRLSETPVGYDRPAPRLGADTEDVLRRVLGLDDARIEELRQAGAIG